MNPFHVGTMSLVLIQDPRTGSIVVPTYDCEHDVVGYFSGGGTRWTTILSEENKVRDVAALDTLLRSHADHTLYASALYDLDDATPLMSFGTTLREGMRCTVMPIPGRPNRFWLNDPAARSFVLDLDRVLQFVESGPVLVGTWMEPGQNELLLTLVE